MPPAIREFLDFFLKNSVSTILSRIRAREVPPLVQFTVYSMCGGLATIVFIGTVVILSKTVIPAYENMLVNGEPISDGLRAKNLFINNCIAFALANVVAYVTNILFVFKPGRYHPVVEFLYFTAVSGVAFMISQIAGPVLIQQFGVPTNLAILTNLVTSMLLNFAGRKFFVFKG